MQYQPLNTMPPPLQGRSVLVTRAAHQSQELASKLSALGAEVASVPLIEILPPDSWELFDQRFAAFMTYDWLLFASVNAVEFTVQRLHEISRMGPVISSMKVAAIGLPTQQAACGHGFKVDFCPTEFTGEILVSQFPGYPNLAGTKILWPRTNIADSHMLERFAQAGAQVDFVTCYQTALPANKNDIAYKLAQMFTSKSIDIVCFGSAQTVRNFHYLLTLGLDSLSHPECGLSQQAPELKSLLDTVIIATIGPETSASARLLLGKVDLEAATHTVTGLVEVLSNI